MVARPTVVAWPLQDPWRCRWLAGPACKEGGFGMGAGAAAPRLPCAVARRPPHIVEAAAEGASLDRSRHSGDGVSSTGESPAARAHLTTS